jgi:hypothetical protein
LLLDYRQQRRGVMKKSKLLIVVAALALVVTLGSGMAQAIPMNYHFTGQIYLITDNTGGALKPAGWVNGTSVEYTVILDFALGGSYLRNNGILTPYADTATKDYFYADYVSGNLLIGGGVNSLLPNAVQEYNTGYNRLDIAGGQVTVGGDDGKLGLKAETLAAPKVNLDPFDWVVGTVVQGDNEAWTKISELNKSIRVYSWLTLDKIEAVSAEPVNAIPEPSTMLLLGFGVVGLGVAGRRKFGK